MKSKILRVIASIFILITLLTPLTVYADPANPDSMDIYNIYVQRYLLEEDDMLIVFRYDIAYAALPDDAANINFIFRLFDTDGTTELGTKLPYPYNDAGYNQGVASFYFSADDAPTWGQSYIIQIAGNPVVFATPPTENFYIATSDYTSSTDQASNQDELASRVVTLAEILETEWTATLLDASDGGTVLYGEGETYFRRVVMGLQSMAPSLFSIQLGTVDFSETPWGTNQSSAYEARYNGTWIAAGLDAGAGLFKFSRLSMSGLIILIAMVALVAVSYLYLQKTMPGLRAAYSIMFCGGVMGWLDIAIIAIVTMLSALYIGYWWFFQKS